MKAEVIKLDPEHPDKSVLVQAAQLLKKGGLVVFPTDTVYGLAGAVFNRDAVEKIFKVKRRPKDKPIAVLISSLNQLKLVTERIPQIAYRLMDKFWPGPLSLVVSCKSNVPSVVTGSKDTIAVRIPNNKIALGLINLAGPLATTSANLTGNPSPKDVDEVARELEDKLDLIIDGGPAQFGEVSTVLDLTVSPLQIVRQGVVTEAELHQVLEMEF